MKRLFFALWPEQSTRQQCTNIIAKLGETGRPQTATNLHVTLLFLGSVDAKQQAALSLEAAKLDVRPMTLTFDQLSFWKKPAVLCLTTSQSNQNTLQLNRRLAAIARQHLLSIDERPFNPHVTLIKKARAPVAIAFEPIVWQSSDFCLAESCSVSGGVEYRILARWPSANPPKP